MEKFVKKMWVCNKGAFEKKIAHLNKILKKHGKEPFKFHYENEHHEMITFTEHLKGDSYRFDTERNTAILICNVVIEGEILIKKEDKNYRYLGSVRFIDGIKQSYCNDKDYEWAFLNFRDGICDHCGTKRMNRKDYFLFEAEGKVIQVGSTCVKEYLGIDSTEYLRCAENTFITIHEADEDDYNIKGASFSDVYGVSFEQMYKFVDFASKGFTHWVKSSDGADPAYAQNIHELSTVDIVRAEISSYFRGDKVKEGNNPIQLTRDECIAYWQSQPITTFTDNIINALFSDGAHPRTIGVYCYGIYGAVNARVKAQMSDVKNVSKPCKYRVGVRTYLQGKVLSFRSYDVEDMYRGGYITRYSVNFQDEDLTLYHFSTGSASFKDVSEGDEVLIRGTIEPAKEYKGTLYTGIKLPRCIQNLTKEKAA